MKTPALAAALLALTMAACAPIPESAPVPSEPEFVDPGPYIIEVPPAAL
ncbi:hypothetical protein AQS8620_01703 [Aquimixticola soesokkakensis]|uniref:Lipoprotein n=1 Tax=Aquimixticola soesokkakensis TaxID=1519096 RepID=A0A1Y5SK88_9RHOB|nr:hypothetical protein [Aquimixticola soesokkakensis]SLN42575.1 hypothetical protein AQS8620_01703 [Aquimixticola soesokkakensis]